MEASATAALSLDLSNLIQVQASNLTAVLEQILTVVNKNSRDITELNKSHVAISAISGAANEARQSCSKLDSKVDRLAADATASQVSLSELQLAVQQMRGELASLRDENIALRAESDKLRSELSAQAISNVSTSNLPAQFEHLDEDVQQLRIALKTAALSEDDRSTALRQLTERVASHDLQIADISASQVQQRASIKQVSLDSELVTRQLESIHSLLHNSIDAPMSGEVITDIGRSSTPTNQRSRPSTPKSTVPPLDLLPQQSAQSNASASPSNQRLLTSMLLRLGTIEASQSTLHEQLRQELGELRRQLTDGQSVQDARLAELERSRSGQPKSATDVFVVTPRRSAEPPSPSSASVSGIVSPTLADIDASRLSQYDRTIRELQQQVEVILRSGMPSQWELSYLCFTLLILHVPYSWCDFCSGATCQRFAICP